MPYVTQDARRRLAEDDAPALNPGELNYVITVHALDLMMRGSEQADAFESAVAHEVEKFLAWRKTRGNRHQRGKNNYQDYNDVIGMMSCCSLELQRRFEPIGVSLAASFILTEFAVRFYATVVVPYEDAKIEQNGDVILS